MFPGKLHISFVAFILLLSFVDGLDLKNYHSNSCIFIGCGCDQEQIKCPANKSDSSFHMFPKRSLYKLTRSNLSLDLSNNNLDKLPDDRFAHMSFFKINMSSNQIRHISFYAFRDIKGLKVLDLSNNFLVDLNRQHFVYFENSLKTLILEKNHLFQLDKFHISNSLETLKTLENLNLGNNDLEELPDLTRLKTLKILYFAANKITKLVDSNYNCLLPKSIVELHFQHNTLKTLNKNAFEGLRNLKYLNLAFNQISEIAEASFLHLTELTELNLRNNYLKHIPSRIFYTLVRLDHLDLSSQKTRLQKIDNYAFDRRAGEQAISLLDLSNNHINEISDRAFCTSNANYHTNIKVLDLQENNLQNVKACVMRQLAIGYLEGHRVLLKASKSIGNSSSSHHLLSCDCELTQTNRWVNIEGDCIDDKKRIFIAGMYKCAGLHTTKQRLACPKQYECLKLKPSKSFDSPKTVKVQTSTVQPYGANTAFEYDTSLADLDLSIADYNSASFTDMYLSNQAETIDNGTNGTISNQNDSTSGSDSRHLIHFSFFSIYNICYLVVIFYFLNI